MRACARAATSRGPILELCSRHTQNLAGEDTRFSGEALLDVVRFAIRDISGEKRVQDDQGNGNQDERDQEQFAEKRAFENGHERQRHFSIVVKRAQARNLLTDTETADRSAFTYGPRAPGFPIAYGSVDHVHGGAMQPVVGAGAEILQNGVGGLARAQVYVGGFEAHGVQQASFVTLLGHGGELDARTIGREAADEPAGFPVNEGIDAADGALKNFLVINGVGFCDLGPSRR